jgi:stage V sporulation protein G
MDVSEVNITPVKTSGSLVAFASCVINGSLYLGSIGLHSLLDGSGYRIVYPTKKVGNRQMHICHPITKEVGQVIEKAIVEKMNKLFAYSGIERSDEQDGRHSKTTHTRT